MKNRVWISLLVVACLAAMGTTGCRRRPTAAGPGAGDNIGGVTPGSEFGAGDHGAALASRMAGDLNFLPEIKFDPVLFDYDSAQIQESERAKVEAAGEHLKRHADHGVLIEGHCDERGSAEYNMALGERRALAVRAYLIGLGVDGAVLQTKSCGEEQPAAMGHDEADWRLNRRAELRCFKR